MDLVTRKIILPPDISYAEKNYQCKPRVHYNETKISMWTRSAILNIQHDFLHFVCHNRVQIHTNITYKTINITKPLEDICLSEFRCCLPLNVLVWRNFSCLYFYFKFHVCIFIFTKCKMYWISDLHPVLIDKGRLNATLFSRIISISQKSTVD